jgi:hypothetical protein
MLPHRSRFLIALLPLIAALSACVAPDTARYVPRFSQMPERIEPRMPMPTDAARQCLANLAQASVRYASLPDQDFGGGCSAINSVKLLDIGTPVTNLGAMTCPLAMRFAAWARYGVQPAARLILGSEIVRIETFGTYNCRPIAGSGKLSEHAHSNAIDISAFVLANGQRISIKGDWRSGGREARFLSLVHDSACKRFKTVLSPDYNAAHHDHFHFDMGGRGGFCR